MGHGDSLNHDHGFESDMRLTGAWPGRVVLRQGWAKAEARPWNADIPDAALRLVRGSAEFLAACCSALLDLEVTGVASPPLPDMSAGMWLTAGFEPHLSLDLYSRELVGRQAEPSHDVTTRAAEAWETIEGIDRAAFSPLWRLDIHGLREALGATPHAGTLLTHDGDRLTGFAIVGAGSIAGYLQRVAVHPDFSGRGFGRSLVRAANQWAKRRGARSMMLNTQPDNEPAARLYLSEGFEKMLDQLTVYRVVRR